nr:unnamed protein product [Callosobruchus analis]
MIPNVEMDIKLTTDIPVVSKPYRMAESEKCKLRAIIAELLEAGIIRESHSSYASPALLVSKKNCDEKRLCVDYRALNAITIKENFPLPLIEDLLDRLRNCRYFSSLDFKSGYHQIAMSSNSIGKTAFITPDNLYEYTRVPFGLCNAPAIFQRAMNLLFRKINTKNILIYLDDVLVVSETIELNINTLKEIFQLLQENNITLNLSKCHFLQESITFLGYNIDKNGISPDATRIEAVEHFPTPANVHQVRQFLGLVGYFRKFIDKFSQKTSILTNLLRKKTAWSWTENHNKAVRELKSALTSNPVLIIFDPTLKTILYTDASRDGIGGILIQITSKGEQPVAYYSKQTSSAEKKYHSFELELLAIVSSIKKFRHYLLGIHFIIRTDCNAVKNTMSKKEIIPRIGRWVLTMQEFNFKIEHRPGLQMRHVDALSRNPVETVMRISEGDWLAVVQNKDKEIVKIKETLESGNWSENQDIFLNYDLRAGKVFKLTDEGRRWVVPKNCRWQIVQANHDELGHFALEKTLHRIKEKYWFPRMSNFVKKYIKSCLSCQYHKVPSGKKPGFIFSIAKYARPFHTLHIDHLGPFVETYKGNKYLLVTVDSFTKFTFIRAVPNTKSKHVIEELSHLISIFGTPKRLISDAGKAFVSSKCKTFCEENGIRHYTTAVAVPRGNGQVERFNRTILDSLATTGAKMDTKDWDKHIDKVQLGINSTINSTIKTTPGEVLFGIKLNSKSERYINHVYEPAITDVTKLRQEVFERLEENRKRQDEYQNRNKRKAPEFKVGEKVLLKISNFTSDGTTNKLKEKFKGPFTVTRVMGKDRYEVKEDLGSERCSRSKRYVGVTAAENMKPFVARSDDIW